MYSSKFSNQHYHIVVVVNVQNVVGEHGIPYIRQSTLNKSIVISVNCQPYSITQSVVRNKLHTTWQTDVQRFNWILDERNGQKLAFPVPLL